MHSALVSAIAFTCTFGGALIGLWMRTALPAHHVDSDSRDSIKAGIGFIAGMTALVLGLVTASAKSSYDTAETAVRSTAMDILTLDRLLARYGPETREIRVEFKDFLGQRIDAIWPRDVGQRAQLDPRSSFAAAESFIERIRNLTPHNAAQESIRGRALELAESLLRARWMVVSEASRSIPLPFLVILLFWLTLIFMSFGLFAPKNPTVIAALLVCALSASSALFLVLELDTPFAGWLKVPAEPMRDTLSRLDQ